MKLCKLSLVMALGVFSLTHTGTPNQLYTTAQEFVSSFKLNEKTKQLLTSFDRNFQVEMDTVTNSPFTSLVSETPAPVIERSKLYKTVERLLAPFGSAAHAEINTIATGGTVPPQTVPYLKNAWGSIKNTVQSKTTQASDFIQSLVQEKKPLTDYNNVADYYAKTFTPKINDKPVIKCDELNTLTEKFKESFKTFTTNRAKQCKETEKIIPSFVATFQNFKQIPQTIEKPSRPWLDFTQPLAQKIALGAHAEMDTIASGGQFPNMPKFNLPKAENIKTFFEELAQRINGEFNTMTPTETSVTTEPSAVPLICTIVAGATIYAAYKYYKKQKTTEKE